MTLARPLSMFVALGLVIACTPADEVDDGESGHVAPEGSESSSDTGSSEDAGSTGETTEASSGDASSDDEPGSSSTSTSSTSDGDEAIGDTSTSSTNSTTGSGSSTSSTTAADASTGTGLETSGGVPGDGEDSGSGAMLDDSDGSDSGSDEGCPHAGNVRYQFNGAESWPDDVTMRLTEAMEEAVFYYNCYSDLSHELTVNYNPDVPTAQANVDGWISFGSDRNYMVVATAMHEVGHTMGVGYSPWNELLQDGRWVGDAVNELMGSIPEDERDPDFGLRDYITADSLHFWPYGLNYASEHLSEWSLINHVRVVAAMNADKQSFLAGR